MRYSGFFLLFCSAICLGQDFKDIQQTILLDPLVISDRITLGISDKYYTNSNPTIPKQNFEGWINSSRLQQFTRDHFMFNTIPGSRDFNSEIILGSTMLQELQLGNMRLSQNYLFDTGGNLQNTVFTIQFRKD